MCPWCKIATQCAGMFYMCRLCWRRNYRNKKSGTVKK